MGSTVSAFGSQSIVFAKSLFVIGMRSVRFGVLAAICAGSFGNALHAQNYLTSTGVPGFATPYPAEMGTVDASSGNLHLEIPLGSFPQRGGTGSLVPKLLYDSHIWNATSVDDGAATVWSVGYGAFSVSEGYPVVVTPTSGYSLGTTNSLCDNDWVVSDDSGVQRYFNIVSGQSVNQCSSGSAYATDSSGFMLQVTSSDIALSGYCATYFAPDGTMMPISQSLSCTVQGAGAREDSNGNYLGEDSSEVALLGWGDIVDTVGRHPLASTGSGWNVANSQNATSVNGYTINESVISLTTGFGQTGVYECQNSSGTATCVTTVTTSIVLPDGSQYTFKYDCDSSVNATACSSAHGLSAYYGLMTSMTLPTGQTIAYGYSNFTDAAGNIGRWLTSKTTGTAVWSYTPTVTSSSVSSGWGNYTCAPGANGKVDGCQQVTVKKPDSSSDVISYALNNGAWPMTIQSNDIDGTSISTAVNTYDFSQPCTLNECWSYAAQAKVGSQWVRRTNTQTTLGSVTKQTSYSYDSPQTGNVTAINEWNYRAAGSSFPTTPDRATALQYRAIGSNNNINRPYSVTVTAGGSTVSQTLITYDSYSGGSGACPNSSLTAVSGVINHDDTNFGASNTARGNPTQISRWVSGSTYLTTSIAYDTTGQVLSVCDPAGYAITYKYADNFYSDNSASPPASFTPSLNGATITTNAYATTVTDSIGSTTAGYYFGSGKSAFASDYNGIKSYAHFMDQADRPTGTSGPIGWSLSTYVSPTQVDSFSAVGDTSPSTGCASCLHAQAILDALGRVTDQYVVNNPAGQVNTSTSYDTMNRQATVSHPNFGMGDPNNVVETASYAALQQSVTHPDGQSTLTAYGPKATAVAGALSAQQGSTATYGVGYPVLTKDEAGNLRQEWIDGFGRVIEVDEPSGAGGLSSPFVTNYLYDAQNNLHQVIQGAQTRTYDHDGLGRLIDETTPEAGLVTLKYVNASGGLCSGEASNPCSKTTAGTGSGAITTTYSYDGGGRLTQTSHSDTTGTVKYSYDQSAVSSYPIGRLTTMTDPTGSESYAYDVAGRVTNVAKVIGGTTYNIGYQYNAADQLTQITYPSGRVVQYAYDNVGHMCAVGASATSCSGVTKPYLTVPSASYDAAGHVLGATYGNGILASAAYSPQRSQLLALNYAKCGSTLFGLSYAYQQDATSCSTGNSAGNNGQIQCIKDFSSGTGDSGRSASYTYDQLGRMLTAKTSGSTQFPAWGLSETYDRYGNRLTQTPTAGTAFSLPSINQANNQINAAGYSYDPSGHLTNIPAPISATYSYDGEDCLTSYNGDTYTCDGNHLRVTKNAGTNTVYIYSNGEVLAEYDSNAAVNSPSREYIFGHQRLATVVGSVAGIGGTITYQHRDHLSPRLYTDASGANVGEQGTDPYGVTTYNNTTSNWAFTTYERDTESGDDYALARAYSYRVGRFQSPDPVEGDPSNPQTWNRYAYVGNDPINITDPSGQNWLDSKWFTDLFEGVFDAVGIAEGGFAGSNIIENYGEDQAASGNLVFQAARAISPAANAAMGSGGLAAYAGTITAWGQHVFSGLQNNGGLATLSNYSAGAGHILSFGVTDTINNWTGASSVVNTRSISYRAGEVTGIGLTTAIGGAAGAEASEANAGKEGFEFSHWIPNRLGGPRSVWNGNWTSIEEHALNDPFRYRFMPRAWKAVNSINPTLLQQWNRIPLLFKGASLGLAYGTAAW